MSKVVSYWSADAVVLAAAGVGLAIPAWPQVTMELIRCGRLECPES